MTGGGTAIRPATPEDHEAIWRILKPVYRAGETYCIPPDITRDEALADWFAAPFTVFVAEADGLVLGTSHVGRNRPGPAAHVANASFATHPSARDRGIARALVAHAKDWARNQGFRAMQFNFVVATNADAVHSWQKAGFDIVGRLPGAFLHPQHGYVDALVMFHDLTGGQP
ncbi:Ribosomal protein S18 acetylase RimI [Paracoccus aminovorans]|uniref:Ribosomal protein S18 acetylase RimI n=1 Tax=Paracoccus aminovorans TaxID=34004 RepID=A0A1I3BDY2_9RHOB|nr:N-acetyltransferase [Paracoccus aminovorans]CQR84785.1 acetyltransferase [Paracoccus aminovorans]SFH60502.1 Ribosomal protein S18 acetylase RimI [Paracoccus aminovorans]